MDIAINNRNDSRKLGVFMKDSLVEVVLSRTVIWPFPISTEAAETLVIKWGFISALEASLFNFSIAFDCVNVVHALKKNIYIYRNMSEFDIILNDIFDLVNC